MSAEYTPAPEVERHPEILDAGCRVVYVFRDKASKTNGKTVLGKARKVSGLNAYLGRADPDTFGEEFCGTVERWGFWRPDVEALVTAALKGEQGDLFAMETT